MGKLPSTWSKLKSWLAERGYDAEKIFSEEVKRRSKAGLTFDYGWKRWE